MANRVFDDRLGVYVVNAGNLERRLTPLGVLGFRDVFLPRTAAPEDFGRVRDAGLYAHLWTATDGLSAYDYANRTLLDLQRLPAGALELNIELPSDPPLPRYVADTVRLIRAKRRGLRMRVNVAPWKGFAFALVDFAADANLYAAVQNYEGNMDNLLSPADVLRNLEDGKVPSTRATVCYAAMCRVLGSVERLRTLPDLSRLHRGVVFSDDLLADAGLIP